jgi:hypothetical protein
MDDFPPDWRGRNSLYGFWRSGLVASSIGQRNCRADQIKPGRFDAAGPHEKARQLVKVFAGLSQLRSGRPCGEWRMRLKRRIELSAE